MRPPPDELLPVMLVEGRAKLAAHAKPYATETRCPRRHLLAATVRTAHGQWLLYRGGLLGQPWRTAWLDEIADPGAVNVRCGSCPGGMVWLLDLTNPGAIRSPH
jgi:predicted transposase YdaD